MLKRIFAVAILVAASFGVFAQSNSDLYDKEADRITEQFNAGKLGRTAAIKEMLWATKTYYPNDRISHAYWQSIIEYSEQLDKKQITKKRYDELYEARLQRYKQSYDEAKEAYEKDRRQAELEDSRRRQAQIDAYNQAAQQQRNDAAIAGALQGVGRAFNNSYGQSITPPMQICNYYGNTRYCQ